MTCESILIELALNKTIIESESIFNYSDDNKDAIEVSFDEFLKLLRSEPGKKSDLLFVEKITALEYLQLIVISNLAEELEELEEITSFCESLFDTNHSESTIDRESIVLIACLLRIEGVSVITSYTDEGINTLSEKTAVRINSWNESYYEKEEDKVKELNSSRELSLARLNELENDQVFLNLPFETHMESYVRDNYPELFSTKDASIWFKVRSLIKKSVIDYRNRRDGAVDTLCKLPNVDKKLATHLFRNDISTIDDLTSTSEQSLEIVLKTLGGKKPEKLAKIIKFQADELSRKFQV